MSENDEEIRELELLARNAQTRREMERVTMRASLLGAKLLSALLTQQRSQNYRETQMHEQARADLRPVLVSLGQQVERVAKGMETVVETMAEGSAIRNVGARDETLLHVEPVADPQIDGDDGVPF